jgi:hypothetical protein
MSNEVTRLGLLAKGGGEVQFVKPLDLPEEDWRAIANLPLSVPRRAGSAVLYGDGARVEAMLFVSKNPDFKSVDDLVITFILEKDAGGAWSARVRRELGTGGCLVIIAAAAGSILAAGSTVVAAFLR